MINNYKKYLFYNFNKYRMKKYINKNTFDLIDETIRLMIEFINNNILQIIHIDLYEPCFEEIYNILSTSSSEVYASTKDKDIPTKEDVALSIDDVYNPRFSYAGTKIFGELLCLNYHKQYNLLRQR